MSIGRIKQAALWIAVVCPLVCSAADHCSNATLNSAYGLHATGTIMNVGDFAAVGRFVFDGRGGLTGKLFVRVNGNNLTVSLTGTYSVSPDCTVTDTWILPDNSISTHQSVLVDEGKSYFILNTTAGDPSVISGEGRRQ